MRAAPFRPIRRGIALLAAAAAVLACLAPTAGATYAGKPGKIVFALGDGEYFDPDLFSIDPTDGSILRLTQDPAPPPFFWSVYNGDYSPFWSPSGRLIAWWREANTPPSDPYAHRPANAMVMEPDGSTLAISAESPTFAPDGSLCGQTFKASPDIPTTWRCVPTEGRMRKPQYTQKELVRVGPQWSPDRRLIVFVTSNGVGGEVFVQDVADESIRQLSSAPDQSKFSPAFSPDGSQVVWGSVTSSTTELVIHDLRTGLNKALPIDVDVSATDGRRFAGISWGPQPVTCLRKRANLVGTDEAEVLVGTKQDDVIAGLGGDDVIKGLKGKDRLCGGLGTDRLKGGPGKDRVRQ